MGVRNRTKYFHMNSIRKSRKNIWDIVPIDTHIELNQDTIPLNDDTNKILRDIHHSSSDKRSRVIYLGRIPHGFYEDEMRAYFSQFGQVTRLRLSRNKKTGASKHYAFIEFAYPEVAEIVAKTMDQYLLKNCLLQCKLVPPERIHPDIWKGANKRFRPLPLLKWAREKHNRERTPEQEAKRKQRIQSNNTKKMELLQQLGITFVQP